MHLHRLEWNLDLGIEVLPTMRPNMRALITCFGYIPMNGWPQVNPFIDRMIGDFGASLAEHLPQLEVLTFRVGVYHEWDLSDFEECAGLTKREWTTPKRVPKARQRNLNRIEVCYEEGVTEDVCRRLGKFWCKFLQSEVLDVAPKLEFSVASMSGRFV